MATDALHKSRTPGSHQLHVLSNQLETRQERTDHNSEAACQCWRSACASLCAAFSRLSCSGSNERKITAAPIPLKEEIVGAPKEGAQAEAGERRQPQEIPGGVFSLSAGGSPSKGRRYAFGTSTDVTAFTSGVSRGFQSTGSLQVLSLEDAQSCPDVKSLEVVHEEKGTHSVRNTSDASAVSHRVLPTPRGREDLKVLYIEDSGTNQKLLTRTLGKQGFKAGKVEGESFKGFMSTEQNPILSKENVTVIASDEQAFNHLKEAGHQYHVIIFDFNLGITATRTGPEICQAAKEGRWLDEKAICIGYSTEQDGAEQAAAVEMDAFLAKKMRPLPGLIDQLIFAKWPEDYPDPDAAGQPKD